MRKKLLFLDRGDPILIEFLSPIDCHNLILTGQERGEQCVQFLFFWP
jgi:hypothetical protein